MKREKVYLKVPFKDKDEVKLLGGRWDPECKRWFIGGERHLEPFRRWLPVDAYKRPTVAAAAAREPRPLEAINELLNRMRHELRIRHMSRFTEKNYLQWVRRFITFHKQQHPEQLGADAIVSFLSYLADCQSVAASTQNQALNALVFLYREVLHVDLGTFEGISWAHKPRRIPVVLSVDEIKAILCELRGVQWLIGSLLYGTGMRLTEALRLRIKDLDFNIHLITIRDAKGDKDRTVPLPRNLEEPLRAQLEEARKLYEQDLQDGFGQAFLPFALERKYPNAGKQWCWQYVFPSHKRSTDPRSGRVGRHHLYDSIMQDAMAKAVRAAGIAKKVNCHTMRHSAATHWLDDKEDIRTVQELLGHNDVKTTMIYTHVTKEKALKVVSPLDKIWPEISDNARQTSRAPNSDSLISDMTTSSFRDSDGSNDYRPPAKANDSATALIRVQKAVVRLTKLLVVRKR